LSSSTLSIFHIKPKQQHDATARRKQNKMTETTTKPTFTFPHPELTPVPAGTTPTYASLQLIHAELNANAISIKSQLGGGHYGHLALCMDPVQYLLLPNAIAFVVPVHPGDAPHHAVGATQIQIIETNRLYARDIAIFEQYHQAETELKRCIIAAVPRNSITALRHVALQYSAVTTLQILTHLDTRYGKYDMAASAANKAKLQAPWNPQDPLDDMWTTISDCRQIAAINNNPISDVDAINAVLDKLTQTGLFTFYIDLWGLKPLVDQTYDNLVLHFDTADNKRRTALTTVQAGYMALQPQPEPSAPTPPAQAPTALAATAPAPRPALANRTNQPTPKPARPTSTGYHYCHTHGINKSHDSMECSYPAAGHIKNATFEDMKGGTTTVFKPKPRTKK
jgi:hypothetical protein